MKKLIIPFCICLLALACNSAQSDKEKITKKPVAKALPAWEDAIFYQIFPERFANGDKNNDPTFSDTKGGWPDIYFDESTMELTEKKWKVHPWESDWYKLQDYEQNIEWHKVFDWAKPNDPVVKYYSSMRRYGGDLQGVKDKLDYLQDLGINAIYLNPIFESPSLHKYDASMYHHIDNNFGPNPEKDATIWAKENPEDPSTWQWTTADSLFLDLIADCHQRGMRIIIDGVFNHTGTTFWAFEDLVKNQTESPYKDWYMIKQLDDPNTAENEFDYDGWIGVKTLPEIREDENGIVNAPAQHIKAIVERWMDPNGDGDPSDGIDGWRLDVAEMVDIKFWKQFNGWVKAVNPDAYITGEIWWHHWPENEMMNAKPWLDGETFDGVMNYRFARALKKFTIDQETQISSTAFIDSLQSIYKDYPWERILTCQNLMDSHDLDRISSQLMNPDRWIDHESDPYNNPDYIIIKPDAVAWQKLRMIASIQFTMPGAPMVYYGTEAGMWGGDDPDDRKPMVWPNINYEAEAHDTHNQPRTPDEVKFDQSLFDFYQKLMKLRSENLIFSRGKIEFIDSGDDKVLKFKRTYENQEVLVIVNNSSETKDVQLSESGMEDMLTGAKFKEVLSLEAFEVMILR